MPRCSVTFWFFYFPSPLCSQHSSSSKIPIYFFQGSNLYQPVTNKERFFSLQEKFLLQRYLINSIWKMISEITFMCEMRCLILDRGWHFPWVCLRTCAFSEEVMSQIPPTWLSDQWERDLRLCGALLTPSPPPCPPCLAWARCRAADSGLLTWCACSGKSQFHPELCLWALLVNLSLFSHVCFTTEDFRGFFMPLTKYSAVWYFSLGIMP